MPVRPARLAASAALLALALAACSDTAGPTSVEPSAAAASAAQVLSYSAVLDGVIQVPLGDVITDCLAEPVEVHYRGRLRVMFAQMANDERSLSSVHMNDMGSWALGVESGTVYRLTGTSIDRSTENAGGFGNGAFTLTTAGRQQYVGPGGAAFTVRSSYGVTITPEGTMTAERTSSSLECR